MPQGGATARGEGKEGGPECRDVRQLGPAPVALAVAWSTRMRQGVEQEAPVAAPSLNVGTWLQAMGGSLQRIHATLPTNNIQ